LELKENGAIELLEEKNITKEKLSETINELLNNQEKIASLKKNMAKYKKIEPLDTIYTLIKALTNKEK
jgi:UDP-N-acetylglucosamine:LPS N-acetylglucosamine transferase